MRRSTLSLVTLAFLSGPLSCALAQPTAKGEWHPICPQTYQGAPSGSGIGSIIIGGYDTFGYFQGGGASRDQVYIPGTTSGYCQGRGGSADLLSMMQMWQQMQGERRGHGDWRNALTQSNSQQVTIVNPWNPVSSTGQVPVGGTGQPVGPPGPQPNAPQTGDTGLTPSQTSWEYLSRLTDGNGRAVDGSWNHWGVLDVDGKARAESYSGPSWDFSGAFVLAAISHGGKRISRVEFSLAVDDHTSRDTVYQMEIVLDTQAPQLCQVSLRKPVHRVIDVRNVGRMEIRSTLIAGEAGHPVILQPIAYFD